MTEHIVNKVNELYNSTPPEVGVGFGYKKVGNQYTDEKVIVFSVVKKLPLSELAQEDILPSTVEINGIVYNTDVNETGGLQFLACDNSPSNPCFQYGYPPLPQNTPNAQQQRPLLGGSAITNQAVEVGSGTLGFIAKHTRTGKLVGVTNAHVLSILNTNFLTLQYGTLTYLNRYGDIVNIAQGYSEEPTELVNRGKIIGKSLFIKRYNKFPLINYTDSGLMSLLQKDFNGVDVVTTESWKQVGLDIGTTPPPFATTAELDNLLSGPVLEIASSGLRTGPKQGTCGLRISQIHYSSGFGQGTRFDDCIEFTRVNPDCAYPAAGGDSGSAAFAKIGGVWKIIGLVFLGSYNNMTAAICRIDRIAHDLGIEAWDGTITPTSFIDPNTIKVVVTEGISGDYSRTDLDGTFYQQGTVTNYAPGDYPCYKYFAEFYGNGCNVAPSYSFNVYSQVPAEVGKYYTYYDLTFGGIPCKVVNATNDLGYYDATLMFKTTARTNCS